MTLDKAFSLSDFPFLNLLLYNFDKDENFLKLCVDSCSTVQLKVTREKYIEN